MKTNRGFDHRQNKKKEIDFCICELTMCEMAKIFLTAENAAIQVKETRAF
jgi:hypothetical protein